MDSQRSSLSAFLNLLLKGETLRENVRSSLCEANHICPKDPIVGELLSTNYRFLFTTSSGHKDVEWMEHSGMFEIPFGVIETVTVEAKIRMRIATKDCRCLVFEFELADDARRMADSAASCANPNSLWKLFAFAHAQEMLDSFPELSLEIERSTYDFLSDFERMGIETDNHPNSANPWRVSRINENYSLCPSYPPILVFPRCISEDNLRAVACFRKRGRVPTLSWCGGAELGYCSLWRCSQPCEGFMKNRCEEDEKLLISIRDAARSFRKLLILDLRPWSAAFANKANGGGITDYESCRVMFGDIENIHHVRDAWSSMNKAVAKVVDNNVGSWIRDLADSCWYDLIGAILKNVSLAVNEIYYRRCNVLVHCSDGWDRTPQVCSLVLLCIDAYYRTLEGFPRLIQKEFCGFGHPFKTRCAAAEKVSKECSPIFIQWLECVYQLLDQFPHAFEFTSEVLNRIAGEVYSNRYGAFLYDTHKERTADNDPYTLSLWSELDGPQVPAIYKNSHFQPSSKPILPILSQIRIRIWEDYWFRYNSFKYTDDWCSTDQLAKLAARESECSFLQSETERLKHLLEISCLRIEELELNAGHGFQRQIAPPVSGDSFSDDNSRECSICFTRVGKRYLNPRHHCRICGNCVCGRCSPSLVTLQGRDGPRHIQRACVTCVAVIGKAAEFKTKLEKIAHCLRCNGVDGCDSASARSASNSLEEAVGSCEQEVEAIGKRYQAKENECQSLVTSVDDARGRLVGITSYCAPIRVGEVGTSVIPAATQADDDGAKECGICAAKVGRRLFKPRHNCGVCGICVCAKCSPNLVVVDHSQEPQRACIGCVVVGPEVKKHLSKLADDLQVLTSTARNSSPT